MGKVIWNSSIRAEIAAFRVPGAFSYCPVVIRRVGEVRQFIDGYSIHLLQFVNTADIIGNRFVDEI
jgi:hypothetical protein